MWYMSSIVTGFLSSIPDIVALLQWHQAECSKFVAACSHRGLNNADYEDGALSRAHRRYRNHQRVLLQGTRGDRRSASSTRLRRLLVVPGRYSVRSYRGMEFVHVAL